MYLEGRAACSGRSFHTCTQRVYAGIYIYVYLYTYTYIRIYINAGIQNFISLNFHCYTLLKLSFCSKCCVFRQNYITIVKVDFMFRYIT